MPVASRKSSCRTVHPVARLLLSIPLALSALVGMGGIGAAQALPSITPIGATGSTVVTTQGCTLWSVPTGITTLQVQAVGAAGANSSFATGRGGDGESGVLTGLIPGSTLDICVNYGGGSGPLSGGSGGGASGVSLGIDFSQPVLVAGGGGSSGYSAAGGDAGIPVASPGGGPTSGGGGNNTTGTGGAGGVGTEGELAGSGNKFTAAGPGRGGDGLGGAGGGGGAGYYGGGGGSFDGIGGGSGGGGGTDFCASSVTHCANQPHAGTQTGAGSGVGQAKVIFWVPATTYTFTTTNTCSSWLVPAGVSTLYVTTIGAAGTSVGGAAAGRGDGMRGVLSSLATGQPLDICVDYGGGAGGSGGFGFGGAGGGASGVSLGSDFSMPALVAGGGGGASRNIYLAGGDAGIPVADSGSNLAGGGGGNNTTMTGGAGGSGQDGGTAGQPGDGFTSAGPGLGGGGASSQYRGAGGGGAGYFGGGGGGSDSGVGSGGGGGTDFCGSAISNCTPDPHAGTASVAGSAAGDAQVVLSTTPPTPTLSTSATSNITLGNTVMLSNVTLTSSSISDTATLAHGIMPYTDSNSNGMVTFKVYGPFSATDTPDCTGTPVHTSPAESVSGSTANSDSYMPTKSGTYYWVASYSGNSTNTSVSGSCGESGETTTVSKGKATLRIDSGSLSQTYNGSPLPVTVTTAPPGLSGVSISYTGTSGTTYGPSTTAPTNAGSYSVHASLSNAGYAASDATDTLVIKRAVATVTADDKSMTYGGTIPTFTDSVVGVITGDSLGTITCAPTTPVSGSAIYTIHCSGGSNPNYSISYVDGTFTVNKATPILNWSNPADITYGTALGSTQLDATAGTDGSFIYTPAAGTVLSAGKNQALNVAFTPSDTTDFSSAHATVSINVLQKTLTVLASSPSMTYGDSTIPIVTCTSTDWVGTDSWKTVPSSQILQSGTPITVTATTGAGLYTSHCVGADAGANYSVSTTNGTFTISKASITPILPASHSGPFPTGMVTLTSTVSDAPGDLRTAVITYTLTPLAPATGTPLTCSDTNAATEVTGTGMSQTLSSRCAMVIPPGVYTLTAQAGGPNYEGPPSSSSRLFILKSAPSLIAVAGDYCAASALSNNPTSCVAASVCGKVQSTKAPLCIRTTAGPGHLPRWTFADAEVRGPFNTGYGLPTAVILQCVSVNADKGGIIHRDIATVNTLNDANSTISGYGGVPNELSNLSPTNMTGKMALTASSTTVTGGPPTSPTGAYTDTGTASGSVTVDNTSNHSAGRVKSGTIKITINGDILTTHWDTGTNSWVSDPIRHGGSMSCTAGSNMNALYDAGKSQGRIPDQAHVSSPGPEDFSYLPSMTL